MIQVTTRIKPIWYFYFSSFIFIYLFYFTYCVQSDTFYFYFSCSIDYCVSEIEFLVSVAVHGKIMIRQFLRQNVATVISDERCRVRPVNYSSNVILVLGCYDIIATQR